MGRNCSLLIKSKNIPAPNIMYMACGMSNMGSASAKPTDIFKLGAIINTDGTLVDNLGKIKKSKFDK